MSIKFNLTSFYIKFVNQYYYINKNFWLQLFLLNYLIINTKSKFTKKKYKLNFKLL
uniref:Uncharacterized protein n=1 Tax=Nephromyces sp. ex Molgula occidentalis TaxID=2544991 RepID=A0A5C1H8I5_9APIC|nr:hypothetical protein [Nephromyces sp. ex Molgula occidentalis]